MAINRNRRSERKFLDRIKKEVDEGILSKLRRIGLTAVKTARDNTLPKKNADGSPGGGTSYRDQTGNLRSSIGFIIVKDGKIKEHSGFSRVKSTATNAETEAMSFAEQLAASEDPSNFVLAIIAGMRYSGYVENEYTYTTKRGNVIKKDAYYVILFTEAEARRMADRMFNGNN